MLIAGRGGLVGLGSCWDGHGQVGLGLSSPRSPFLFPPSLRITWRGDAFRTAQPLKIADVFA